ncbi:hypothetical protein EDB86DRAFT_2832248 [Lactarius hatsudake]|nr:hypothetical protein EDB86DRAFT_2832248 [Lactarius hatsudake]
MPRRRAAESLLPAEDGIEEVIIHHRRTKRGIRTTEKAVPILLPSKAKPGQSSHLKQGKDNDQLGSDTAEGSQVILNSLGDTQSQQFIDEQMEGLPDDEMEQGRPQPTTVMEQWIQLRSKYLHMLLEMESHPSSSKCSLCYGHGDIKCPNCVGTPLFCKSCCVKAHRHSPFHRPLLWTATHYTPVSLHSLGYVLFFGHAGEPCPQTVEGIRAAKGSHGKGNQHTRHGSSSSLQPVQEELESLQISNQLPISTAPIILDTLFDHPDIPLDPVDMFPDQVQREPSGNQMLTIVDRSGIFEMEAVFCVCSETDNQDEQLLQSGFFPATFKQIRTLFTFSVLDDFLNDNLECKTTAQQYYSKLQSLTSRMFPSLVPLLRMSRQWRDIKSRMEQGLGHQSEDTAPDGSLAIFCPACPQPGINLPNDWKTRYEPNELIRTFIMDGNFSAEHMRHRSGERDVALSAGMAFMANPELYKAHLQSGTEIVQPSTCNTYKAIEQANSSRAHLDVTGIGATACCHGFFVPTSVVDFQKGERQINMDYSICKALSYNMEDMPVALVMYDIMCQYRVHFEERIKSSPELSLPSSESLELRMGIGLFHIHGHQDSCLPRFSPSYIPGAKQVDGEIIETLWAPLNNISRSTRGMSLVHRQEVLDTHMNHSNWKKLVRIVPSLLKRWKRLGPGLDASSKAFESLSEHFKEKTQQWLKEDIAAQTDRGTDPSSMDIYDTVKQKAPSRAEIQLQLMVEEDGDHSIRGETSWISCGLKIQEIQLAIRYQLRSHGMNTIEESQIIENKRIRLQKLVDMFSHQADAFLLHHQPIDDAPIPSLGDYAEYDHVDDMDDSLAPRSKAQVSDISGMEGTNAEDIPILLPSTLGLDWCIQHGVRSLAIKEAKLRYAQANDSIHRIRLALGFKSALFRTQVRSARTQKTKTRAWTAVQNVDTTVHEHARNYGMARDAYIKVQQASDGSLELPPLHAMDLRVKTAILGAAEVGQRNTQLPWIWSFGTSNVEGGAWFEEFSRVHWLRAKAQHERWKEEDKAIKNEAMWVPQYFHAKATCWKAWMDVARVAKLDGHNAYASYQAHAWEEMCRSSMKALVPITSSSSASNSQ